jgi:hypothetical protein
MVQLSAIEVYANSNISTETLIHVQSSLLQLDAKAHARLSPEHQLGLLQLGWRKPGQRDRTSFGDLRTGDILGALWDGI